MSEWRVASADDAGPLADLERAANLVALAHVFPPEHHPFPYDDVRDRWVAVLADPAVTVLVVDGAGGLVAVTAYDAVRLRHVAVRPTAWGRGLGSAAVARAEAAGARRLWVLEANRRARALYERRGWRPGGERRRAEWPPRPLELEYLRDEPTPLLGASEG